MDKPKSGYYLFKAERADSFEPIYIADTLDILFYRIGSDTTFREEDLKGQLIGPMHFDVKSK